MHIISICAATETKIYNSQYPMTYGCMMTMYCHILYPSHPIIYTVKNTNRLVVFLCDEVLVIQEGNEILKCM